MLSPFDAGRFGAFAPGGAPLRSGPPPMGSGATRMLQQQSQGSQSNGTPAQSDIEGVRVDHQATYVLQPADVVRGRAKVDGADRVIVVTRGRVGLVPSNGLLRPALQGSNVALGGSTPPDAEARKRKIAMIAGLSLSGVAMVGSIIAGVVAEKTSKKEKWDPSVDGADGDAASSWIDGSDDESGG